MSLIKRDDYDALVRAAKQLPVYERLPYNKDNEITRPGRGCFDCDHSVGSMSEGKKYSSVFFFPWWGALNYESQTHLVYSQLPHPRFSVVMSPEDKFYTDQSHFMRERIASWDPPSSILVTRLHLDKLVRKDMYVRLLCTYDENGDSEGVRHINGRIDISEEFESYEEEDSRQFIVISSSTYLRGAYVDLEMNFGLDDNDLIDEAPAYQIEDMLMTDEAWNRATSLYGAHLGLNNGPNLIQLKDPDRKKTKRMRKFTTFASADGADYEPILETAEPPVFNAAQALAGQAEAAVEAANSVTFNIEDVGIANDFSTSAVDSVVEDDA